MIERYGKKSSSTLTLNPCTSFNTWKRCKVKIGCAPCCPLTRLVATCSSQQALPVATPLQTLGTLWQTEALLHSALRLENGRIISNQCCIANCIDRYPCCGRSQRVRAMSHVSYYFIHHRLAEFEAHWISRRNRPRLVESYCVIVSCHIMYILCIYYVKRCLNAARDRRVWVGEEWRPSLHEFLQKPGCLSVQTL